MNISVELTLYPLQDDYLPAIKAIVERLNNLDDIQVQTFPTGTVLMGQYDRVMDEIKASIAWSYDNYGKSVFVAKFLPGYEAL